ncbi:MAG: 5'-methylthioadenosine/adenosylhomocysteine nucleosidase [Prevotella sp.]|nr:5'-methylthioadenosine/adenosylhomocysteine nucleosidase [Bacteroides sp.]MCM1365838.1 5'-methylthioadenosine/adenosylhomocysteine nucleosidase [Prevotella sp.]MCM1436470.1 5'-methylthioadenosine/adenosylhomocysteine nucleosidase [Prevotella sp.]
MKIGIIVAMEKELKLLLPIIENKGIEEVRGVKMYRGKMGNHEVMVCQCGIGKVNSAIRTLGLIEAFTPELVINTGVAGGADASMHVLDIFIAEEVAYHDVWCGPGTKYGAAAGFEQKLYAGKNFVEKSRKVLGGDKVKYGLICSGDKFISGAEEIKEIKKIFPEALAVDMESASIAQVCMMEKVPFNILRVISDTPGEEENISQYENFWSDAPRETFESLVKVLDYM